MALSDDVVIRGLALVRHLYASGDHQSRQTGFGRATAVLTFHDAVEMLLVLGLQHHGVYSRTKLYRFDDYWTELDEKKDVKVTQHGAMQRLNNARIGLKHHATLPPANDVDDARVATYSFLIENTPIVFGGKWSFENLKLSALVASGAARSHLEAAEGFMAAGDGKAAMEQIACAFAVISRRGDPFVRLRLRSVLEPFNVLGQPPEPLYKAERNAITAAIEELHTMVRVLSRGLDFNRWERFVAFAPRITERHDGRLTVAWARPGGRPPTVEQCRECYDFVIDSAVRLQESAAPR